MRPPATRPPRHSVSAADYFRFEHESTERHEFRDGRIVAVPAGDPGHSLITANLLGEVGRRLKGGSCRVYASPLRLRVGRGRRYAYADACVICGAAEVDADDPFGSTVTNPKVIIEVVSPSTEAYDRGEKFCRYLEIPGFQEYVLASQVTPVVETITRRPDGSCLLRIHEGLGAVARVRTLDVDLPLADVYLGVEFAPAEPP